MLLRTRAGYAVDNARRGSCELCGLIVPAVFLPFPWQQFVETALRRPGDAAEHVGEPGLRVDVGADESRDRSPKIGPTDPPFQILK